MTLSKAIKDENLTAYYSQENQYNTPLAIAKILKEPNISIILKYKSSTDHSQALSQPPQSWGLHRYHQLEEHHHP